jgi:hypothetical protein
VPPAVEAPVVLLWVLLVHLNFLDFLALQGLHHLLAVPFIIVLHSSYFELMLGSLPLLLVEYLALIKKLCFLPASL